MVNNDLMNAFKTGDGLRYASGLVLKLNRYTHPSSRICSTAGGRRQLCLNIVVTLPPKPPRLDLLTAFCAF